MENLKIAGTERSPAVDFDCATGVFTLKGESYPEDASSVFGPIFATLETFLARTTRDRLRFDIELIYFNSSSAKALMNMFQLLERAAGRGIAVEVNWIFAAEDETMKEFGDDFSEDLDHVTFNLVSIDP